MLKESEKILLSLTQEPYKTLLPIREGELWGNLSVWADALEDESDPLVSTVRWMVANQKRPYPSSRSDSNFVWFARTISRTDPQSDLSPSLCTFLKGEKEEDNQPNSFVIGYNTFLEAVKDLHQALQAKVDACLTEFVI